MCEYNIVPASPDGDAGFLLPVRCESETCEDQCYRVHRYDGGDDDGILKPLLPLPDRAAERPWSPDRHVRHCQA